MIAGFLRHARKCRWCLAIAMFPIGAWLWFVLETPLPVALIEFIRRHYG